MAGELYKLSNISKTFPGVKALQNISFDLRPGEIHCLCGENGAGKSTLIKVMAGTYQPDPGGRIEFEGKVVNLPTPFSAIQLGVQTIYQEHTIFPTLSVTENIFAGLEVQKGGLMDFATMKKKTQEVLNYLNSNISPDAIAGQLSSGEQKIVEFAKALVFDRKVIILDEPTASFSVTEIENLLETVKKIKERGIGIIYISHHLDEVFRIADRITILRDGKLIRTVDAKDIDQPQLVREMVGRDASAFYHRDYYEPGEPVLEVEGLSGNGVNDINFTLRRGEILGFAGMVGSGRSELMDLLVGKVPKIHGTVKVMGKKVNFKSPADSIKKKICYITEDRQGTGLFLIHSIARNTILANMVNTKGSFMNPRNDKKVGDEFIKKLKTKANDSTVLAGNLSGGNQQKVVLAKWFNTDGEIFIFDEPTRGIDIGAKQEIYQLMLGLLQEGKAIIMVSSDQPEVVSMSDRVIIMKDGNIVGRLDDRSQVSEENILKYSIGGTKI